MDEMFTTFLPGNVFAGASLPYGLAKAVADTDSDSNQGGFTTDGAKITGFSSMHDSGTGGSPSLGLFPLFAYAECANDTVNGCVFPKKSRATPYKNDTLNASPGYFGLELESGVKGEMTVTEHASLFLFTFPPGGSGSPVVFLDLTDLSNSRQDNASISVDSTSGRMTGESRFKPSFGQGDYVAYFCADFQGSDIRDTGIYADSRGSTEVKDVKISRGINGAPPPAGAFVRFTSKDQVLVRVGLSFISSEQACSLAEDEIPGFDFMDTHTRAEDIWREKMSPIVVSEEGVTTDDLKNFYSGIYRTMMSPQNYTGVVPVVDANTMYFDSFYW